MENSAAVSPEVPSLDSTSRAIAIVGLGPRGLSVLERLLIRLRQDTRWRHVVIWTVDAVEHGPGRVWRTDQPEWLAMNATASEVTMQSPDSHLSGEGFVHPHTLSAWTESNAYPHRPVDAVDTPPRRVYGEYLRDVFARLCASTPPGVEVRAVLGEATRLRRVAGRLCLTLGDGSCELPVDKVVLATGHAPLEPTEEQLLFLRHATRHRRCTYLGQEMAPDMPLDDIPSNATVALRGLGLTFYDVVRSLTLGRGGQFIRERSGRLRYLASGREPLIVAGSRSGLPFLARPRVTEAPDTPPRFLVLTEERIADLRAEAKALRGSPKLDFAREVEPLVHTEVDHAYYGCAARLRGGHEAAEAFLDDFRHSLDGRGRLDGRSKRALLARHGLDDMPSLRLHLLARPFDDQLFQNARQFRHRLLDVLRSDLEESRKGTRGSPLKAACDVLRRIRPLLPSVVDFGGLLPASHQDFLERFEPLNFSLSAGPPDAHVDQLVCLIEAGLVHVVGPAARFEVDDAACCYVAESPRVQGSRCTAEVLVDARIPTADVRRTASRLTRRMLSGGMISQYVNTDPTTGERFETGGLAVTGAPFRIIDSRGRPDPDVYAIGVAIEKTRWYTQVGTGRPGQDSPFRRDADAIAADLLRHDRADPVEAESQSIRREESSSSVFLARH